MNHVDWAKFETWSINQKKKKKCRSCGVLGDQDFIEVEDKDGIGWACPTCFGEQDEIIDGKLLEMC